MCIGRGECVTACSKNMITPCRVEKNDENCTNCGKCFDACEYNAIEKEIPSNYHEPFIVQDICNKCRECHVDNVCEYDAIEKELPQNYHNPYIDTSKCSLCGDCITKEYCEYTAIEKIEPGNYFKPFIDMDTCTSCATCMQETICTGNNAIKRDLKHAYIMDEKCTKCGKCKYVCSYEAIVPG